MEHLLNLANLIGVSIAEHGATHYAVRYADTPDMVPVIVRGVDNLKMLVSELADQWLIKSHLDRQGQEVADCNRATLAEGRRRVAETIEAAATA